MNVSVFTTGLTMGLSLIVAIGAQNAFVLRQGLRGEHVLAVCLACALSDAVLIIAGVVGFRQIAEIMPGVEPVMRYGGAAFLIWYGAKSLLAALRSSDALVIGNAPAAPLGRVLATCLALTWLNPHVYLDTVVLLGSLSTQFPGQQTVFAAGAVTASFVFFFTLGFGAKWLRPVFARPSSWRILEAVIAVVMWSIAFKLISSAP
ncbi:LysE/ArgO family amino acid transporter [Pseudochelatococcus contaminans]|uniref:L-lysine exporter family protein LysE/ArgO n=1 Tax=Pseudochelatococcus contaminans TaxID=1538103 RepID=A0A7W5Z3T0_9HYPH|nr:LysE/ArgO family amino acid transporter [Pseudochelatococcus contaminans]MBB3809618.1 L-lysine exporter family protein LysE/ArgO [Pseudochelatococcus contaminans]